MPGAMIPVYGLKFVFLQTELLGEIMPAKEVVVSNIRFKPVLLSNTKQLSKTNLAKLLLEAMWDTGLF